jgi:hypothetical protein
MNMRRVASLAVLILPVLIWFSLSVFLGVRIVAETGTCSVFWGPSRPCTVVEYLTSHLWRTESADMAFTLFFAMCWWGLLAPPMLAHPVTKFLKARLPVFVAYITLGLCLAIYIRFLISFVFPGLLLFLYLFHRGVVELFK